MPSLIDLANKKGYVNFCVFAVALRDQTFHNKSDVDNLEQSCRFSTMNTMETVNEKYMRSKIVSGTDTL